MGSNIEALIHYVEKSASWNEIHGKKWKRTALLGSGTYGSVYIGQRVEDGMVFAVKSTPVLGVNYSEEKLRALMNEMEKLVQIRCKYIVRMLGCSCSDGSNSFDPTHNGVAMLDVFLEYIPRGSLHHLMWRLEMGATTARSDLGSKTSQEDPVRTKSWAVRHRRLPEDFVRAYTADILRGVDYLHRKQLVHGDIKPMNLLLAEDSLKLADFGGCKSLKKVRSNFFQIHTRVYSAPEVHYKLDQGFASDIFSVGCTVLEMTSGKMPRKVFIPQWLSKDGQNFLRRCLTTDPRQRWTAAQLLDHPFIRDRDQNDRRPYSTVIPQEAERMILQPPPILSEAYTNTLLSPTFRGPASMAVQVPFGMETQRNHFAVIDDSAGYFRRERISISSPTQIAVQAGPQFDAIQVEITGGPSTPKEGAAQAGAIENAMIVTGTSYHPILPVYKPEFVPPEDESLHFLLGPGSKRKGDDFKARDEQALPPAETPKRIKLRPPRLVIPDQPPNPESSNSQGDPGAVPRTHLSPKNVTLLPRQISSMSEQDVQQLVKSLPRMEECNQDIRVEARKAVEAGIYVNKLCPGGTNEG